MAAASADTAGLFGRVLRSLISALTGDEAENYGKHIPPDWQTAEDKVRAARRQEIIRRRMAHCNRATPTLTEPATAEKSGNT